MTSTLRRPLILALALSAISDLAAVPLLLSTDGDAPPAALGVLVGVLGLLTAVAALGMARGCDRPRPMAWGTRVLDLCAALPALGAHAGGSLVTASAVTVVLSGITLVLLVLTRQSHRAVAT